MTNLQSILDELYALDPTLKSQEEELIPVIKTLLKHRPDAEPDPAFIEQLRMLLKERAAESKASSLSSFPAPRSSVWSAVGSFFTMNKFTPVFAGVLLGVLITGPAVYSYVRSGTEAPASPESGTETALFAYQVEETSDEAFGDFANQTMNSGMGGGGDAAITNDMRATRPQSGGGGGNPPVTDMDSKMMVDPMIYPPEITEYNLSFEGELPELTAQQVAVLKRQKNLASTDAAKFLNAMNLGSIDLNSFKNAKADSISFYEDREYGYMASVNFREGSIYISQNWEQWPHPESTCQTEDCYQRFRTKIGDVPADDVLIDIANDFVRDYNIDLAQYGNPEVDNMWRTSYEAAMDKSMYYIPDVARVVYPLLVEGKPVYEEGGSKVGIYIGVNVKERKVSDAYGMMDQKFLSSDYDAVTDSSTITSFLEKFGKNTWEGMPEDMKRTTVNVTLGTPTMGFTKLYIYENNTSDELVIPALIFPVTNVSDGGYFYRETIAVPLAKDLLDRMVQGSGPVMPLMMR